jgi:glycosyltransferase involved in cell wall biosynthesis
MAKPEGRGIGDTGVMNGFNAGDLFISVSWLLALAWLWQAVTALRGMPTLPDLTRRGAVLPPLPEAEGPDCTVIVPACNEENSIQATLRSLLASTGVRLQIIAVNDRSTDRTGALMEAVTREAKGTPHELSVIHIQTLPADWLGKPHAMDMAAKEAKAPWLLFTDGDVIFEPQALHLALHETMARKTDHLVLVPTLIFKSMSERAMLAAMQTLSQWTVRMWKVADPSSRDFIGVGGFNLIRRDVYTKVGGFEALRMEVLDDLRLGWLVKRAGYAQRVAVGCDLVRIRWLQSALAVVHLVEKNGFSVYRFRVGLFLLACLGLAFLAVWPLAALAAGGWALGAGITTYLAIALVYAANQRVTQASAWLAVFFAPATAVVLYAFVRSMVLALYRNGIEWRGTHYSLDELRQHAGTGW